MNRRILAFVTVIATSVAMAGCGGGSAGSGSQSQYPSPQTLDIPRSQLPGPGLCKVLNGSLQRTCEGISLVAPEASNIAYRPNDNTRIVIICIMSREERGVIVGIDVYNIYNNRLIDVLMRANDEPFAGDCDQAVAGRVIQGS